MGNALANKKAQSDQIKKQDAKIQTIEEEVLNLQIKRGPPGPRKGIRHMLASYC